MIFALVAGWSCAEAILFFIVVDVALSAIALQAGLRKALLAAIVAALAAVPGAWVTVRWAAADDPGIRASFERLPAIDAALIDASADAYSRHPWRATVAGSFSGVPFKLYARAAGRHDDAWGPFLSMTPLLRLPRFIATILVTSTLSRTLLGAWPLRRRVQLLAGCWLTFYGCFFLLH